jgi:hypothetical protein
MPTLATGGGQAGEGACLISRKCAGSSPAALRTEGTAMTKKPGPLQQHGPLTQWQSLRLLIGWPRVRSPDGPRTRRWRNGTAHLASNETAPGSNPGRRAHAPLDQRKIHQALNLEMRVRSPHGARRSWPHRLWVRIRGFHPRERGSTPRGATARWCNGNMPAS